MRLFSLRLFRLILALLVTVSSCSKDDENNRTDKRNREEFSLAQTGDEDWVKVNAYGNEFLYPKAGDDVEEAPHTAKRWPLTMIPYIEARSHNNETVAMIMTIDGDFDVTKCDEKQPDLNPLAKKIPKTKWAGWSEEVKQHTSGLYMPYLHAYYRFGGKCTKIFFYEAALNGTVYPVSMVDETPLGESLRKIVDSYRMR